MSDTPEDLFDADNPSTEWFRQGRKIGYMRLALRTRQIDITMQEDVRAGQRRLVEVDDAGNVVREFTELKP